MSIDRCLQRENKERDKELWEVKKVNKQEPEQYNKNFSQHTI
jgi:hypothetical protein